MKRFPEWAEHLSNYLAGVPGIFMFCPPRTSGHYILGKLESSSHPKTLRFSVYVENFLMYHIKKKEALYPWLAWALSLEATAELRFQGHLCPETQARSTIKYT